MNQGRSVVAELQTATLLGIAEGLMTKLGRLPPLDPERDAVLLTLQLVVNELVKRAKETSG